LEHHSAERGSAVNRTFNSSVLLGLDMVLALVAVLCTSIPLARVIGPDRLGYFMYIQWMAMASSNVVLLGIPATTRRYMAEALGRNDLPAARGVFFATLRIQTILAFAVLVVGEILVFSVTDRSYWSSSWLIVLSLVPRMIMSIPSMAHMAGVRLQSNLIATAVSTVVLIGVMGFGLWTGWGLIAAAAAYATANFVELSIKLTLALRWLGTGPRTPIGPELRKRMLTFSTHGTALLILNIVVWDKSDLFFLELLRKEHAALAFFNLAFNLADRAIQIVQVFVSGLSVSLMSELGRSAEKMYVIAKSGLRYSILIASVLLFGLAAVGPNLILTLYGRRYSPAGPLLSIAAALAVGKCLMPLLQSLFQAAERQQAVVAWSCCCGALNVILDLALIPHMGALGAVLANGSAQALAAVGLIYWAQRTLGIDWSIRQSVPGLLAGVGTGLAAYGASLPFALAPVRLGVGILAGAIVFPILLRILCVLQPEDLPRILGLTSRLAPPLRRRVDALLGHLA
jgi:O-antigen/teichoic acid export membrane protein